MTSDVLAHPDKSGTTKPADEAPERRLRDRRWWQSTVAISLALFSVVAVGSFTRRSFFLDDDFYMFDLARTKGLTLDFLTSPFIDHFVPGHRLADYLLQRFFPWNFAAAQVILLSFLALAVLLVFAVLRELFGFSLGTCLLTLLFGTSLAHVGDVQWWAAGMHGMPCTALSLGCIYAYLRYRRTGRSWWMIVSVLALVLAMTFYVKAILVPGYLVMMRVLLLQPDRPLRDTARDALREWRVWLAYITPVIFYLLYYFTKVRRPSVAPELTFDIVVEFLWSAWSNLFVPSVVGYRVIPGVSQEYDRLAVMACQAAFLVVFMLSLLRSGKSWRGWTFLGVAFVVNFLFVVSGRITYWSDISARGHDLRYASEVTYLLPVALGAALSIACARPLGTHARTRWQQLRPTTPGSMAVAAMLVHLVVAWHGGRTLTTLDGPHTDLRQEALTVVPWHEGQERNMFGTVHAVREYVENLLGDVERLRLANTTHASLINGPAPSYVVPPYLSNYNPVSRIIGLKHANLTYGLVTPRTYSVDSRGHLVPARFVGESGGPAADLIKERKLSVTGDERIDGTGVCVTAPGDRYGELKFNPPGGGDSDYLSVSYRSRGATELYVIIDPGEGYPRDAGQRIVIPAEGSGTTITPSFTGSIQRAVIHVPRSASVCIDRIEAGAVVSDGSQPR